MVGLDDSYTDHHDVDAATRGLDLSHPILGLSHIAEDADALWSRGVPLVLSGHTHGGQITVARLNELALGHLIGHRYVHGLYGDRAGHGAVYVGAGIGASVMPLRLGERGQRELTFFELGAEAGDFLEHHDEQPAFTGREISPAKRALRAKKAVKKAAKRAKKHAGATRRGQSQSGSDGA